MNRRFDRLDFDDMPARQAKPTAEDRAQSRELMWALLVAERAKAFMDDLTRDSVVSAQSERTTTQRIEIPLGVRKFTYLDPRPAAGFTPAVLRGKDDSGRELLPLNYQTVELGVETRQVAADEEFFVRAGVRPTGGVWEYKTTSFSGGAYRFLRGELPVLRNVFAPGHALVAAIRPDAPTLDRAVRAYIEVTP